MAETTYDVEWVAPEPDIYPDYTIPMIARIIMVDGVEVSRGYPDFKEVAAAYPPIIETYFDALRDYFSQLSTWLDNQTTFTRESEARMAFLGMLVRDYQAKFDQDIDFPGVLV